MKLLILTVLLPFFATSGAFAQTFFCSAFSITNVYQDKFNPNDYLFSIQCVAGPNEFASYPVVSAVVDCNGDTVATGVLFYFGHFGQTIQDYPVTLTGNGDINCYPLTASFIINYEPGFTDTCQLIYGNAGLNNLVQKQEQISIVPNPSSTHITIGTSFPIHELKSIALIDASGKVHDITYSKINTNEYFLDVSSLNSGFYVVNFLTSDEKTYREVFVKE